VHEAGVLCLGSCITMVRHWNVLLASVLEHQAGLVGPSKLLPGASWVSHALRVRSLVGCCRLASGRTATASVYLHVASWLLQHHAHHIDSRWMVCSASGFSFVSGAQQTSICCICVLLPGPVDQPGWAQRLTAETAEAVGRVVTKIFSCQANPSSRGRFK
jgi:hypothetical protein